MAEKSLGERTWYRHWPDQVAKCLDYPEETLAGFLERTALQYGSQPAICFLDTWIDYSRLWDLVRRLATALDGLGLKQGDVCALMLPNSPQFVISYYAGQLLGLAMTPINPTYKALEVKHQLSDSGAKAFIVLDAIFDQASAGLAGTKVEHIIGTNVVDLCGFSALKIGLGKLFKKIPKGNLPPQALKFTDLLDTEPNPPPVKVGPDDVAVLQYTGGTTGLPKGAMLTHRNLVANAVQCEAWLWLRKVGMGIIGVLPLFHVFAMTTVMNTAIRIGGFQLLFPRPPADMEELFGQIVKHAPSQGLLMPGVAVLFNKINSHPKVRDYDLSGLKMAISGAGPLPLEIQDRFEELTHSVIVEGYGLTEASPVTHANPIGGRRKQGTIGLPYPDTEIKIMDAETGEKELPPLPFALSERGGLSEEEAEVAREHTGELVVKGPQVMKGYLNKPEETAACLRDGWLYTGDIACLDAEGYTIIRDRAKDLIKFKGYPVFPAEVEDYLHAHPAVNSVAVIGLPDEKFGEIVKAFIVLEPGSKGKVTAEEIKGWATEKMTKYKVPAVIEFRDELPTTMVGKVLRRILKEEERAKAKDR
ncbi:MAG: long-chain fatty acid--CoA ligase [Deltaproteobacteria bacterium]|nr:long-chain fatty acid--CoA ligase [Deltaproteobacteria bacterium]